MRLQLAAAYCDMSAATFERICPVPPISMAGKGRSDRRLLRYDAAAIDDWLDFLSGRVAGDPEQIDWASKVG
jgi:hypothetical protein